MRTRCIALLLLLVPFVSSAQNPPAPSEVQAGRATSPIEIDGDLAEAAWQSAEVIRGFRQRDPNEGAPASQPTDVRVTYDDDALYVCARMHDARPDSIVALLMRRDGFGRSDFFTVYLDPYHDRRSGYFFGINAAGSLADGTLYNDGWRDNSWDAVWHGRAKIDSTGWTAEMRIPFSQLRFAKSEVQTWGINFHRTMGRGFEDSYLVYQPRNESGFVSRFPTLVGLHNVSPGGAIEVVPYATTKAELLRHDPDDPFNDGMSTRPAMGGDVRMALGNKLTLNATVNPDFGQVEVDPAVVNLSDFETFFPEKRPFFVEGSSIFSAGQQGASDYWNFSWQQPTFFYSRRIGRAPIGSLPGDVRFADVPVGTTILGAAKVSGKLSEGLNFGMLHALTSRENAEFERFDGSRTSEFEVEPLTYYGVVRALREFPERRHGLGVISTLAARRFGESRLRDEFNRLSSVTAVDGWHFLDHNQVWVLSGWAGASYVAGSRARITSVQTSPRHYYQRPDAESFSLDPDATSLAGSGARVWLNKGKGNWFSNSAVGLLSPGFEPNDLGFLNRADLINGHAMAGYRWSKPTKHVKNHSLQASVYGGSDFDGNLTDAGIWGSAFWWYTNNWTAQVQGTYSPETVNPRRSRGGPLMLNRKGYSLNTFFDTDGSRPRYYYLVANGGTQPEENTWNTYFEGGFTWKPRSNVSISIGPSFERSHDGAYFFTRLADAAATSTYGNRYLFTQLDQKTFAANLRLNISFRPDMSLQFFGQPLVSTGAYRDVRELARPRSLDFLGPGAGAWTYDPASGQFDADGAGPEQAYVSDFNFKSLRGNAVFRWEYSPGAAMYLVWTQQRTDEESLSRFELGPSFRRLASADADNIFLAKLTYYWNL